MGQFRYGVVKINEGFFEDVVVEHLVEELGYEHLYGPDVERTDDRYRDVFLPRVLPDALRRINPALPRVAVEEAVRKLNDIDAGSLEQRNEIFNGYLQNGVEVHFFDGKEDRDDIVYLIDYSNPDNNDFHVVNQWTFVEHSEKRPDVIVFVNGMPLVLFELKSPSREETDASEAYLQLRNYMKHVPSLFVPNVFCVMSDMSETRVGTITADEDRYVAWKSVDGDYSQTRAAGWSTMLDGMLRKDRLLDLVKNFVCFNNNAGGSVKILAAYHQYFAVKKAVIRAREAIEGDGKIGVFWHTQGSGKSLSMVFFAHLLQDALDSPTIVVITDRNDLDDQLFGQFSRCASFLRQTAVQAESRRHLKELLVGREANGIIFTTMQKFMDGDEPLCDRSNVVVMVDEAHRGQYGLTEKIDAEGNISIGAARIVRKALPNASYIGFTGTPISTQDRSTREIFGDYIDVYDMTQAVEDNATRPVYYESRVVALKLDPETLGTLDAIYSEFANEADEVTLAKSKRDLGGMDAIFGAPETIDALCEDIIDHYENNRADVLAGKALVVAYSRTIAMKIYERMMELRPDWTDKLGVVMTMGNQDPEEWFSVCGGATHKKEMERKFKDENDPLKIAIVVDMWLTGFDVPSLATMYVFKPMKGHNLMQAIARVNRVCRGKEGGLVVDYIGIARALKQAMRDYTNRDQRNYGDMDVSATAYPRFLEKLDVCRDLLYGFNYEEMVFSGSDHYENNRADVLAGKALVVAYSRTIAMKIYERMMELRPDWTDKLGVVMTMGNQDPEEWFSVCGGATHKKEMERKFKDENDPLKIAIVVDMWLTGFDVPSLATMYVFKPMKGHNLMQAIARVNRVCRGKEGGLVVDYIGIARALKQAMRDYTNRDQRNYGDMDVSATAYPRFLEKLDVCRDLLYGFNYEEMVFSGSKAQLAEAISEGTNWLLEPDRHEDREEFLKQCQLMNQALSLCKSLVSEKDQHEAAYMSVLRVQVLRLTGRKSSSGRGMTYKEFNQKVSAILEQAVHAEGVIDLFEEDSVEISLFDEAFLEELSHMKQRNIAVESLKRLIKEQVKAYQKTSVVKAAKFSEMLQGTLNAYLNGMLTNAQVIEELVKMAKEMMRDRSEAEALGLTDEEMAFYDAITKPQAVKDFYDNDQLVAITRELTEAMRRSATIDWQRKENARAGMRRAIKRLLRKYKYPPEGVDDAMETVMAQCELWADTKIYE